MLLGTPVIGLLTLTGCTGAVAVADPAPGQADSLTCTQLLAALPEQVLDQDRRRVEPGLFSAAWGKPAIALRCGVTKPPSLTAASECLEVNGVGWFAEPASGGALFTTIGRKIYVEVGVPSAYAPEVNALVDLAAVVTAHDPLVKGCV